MKKISIVLVSVLSIAAFTGCKKKAGDCGGTINGLMDRMKAEHESKGGDKATPEQKKMETDMMKTMSDSMTKVCTDDKWSADVLKCLDDAKTKSDAKKCEASLTPDQVTHMKDAEMAMMGGMAKQMSDGSGSGAAMAGSAAAPAAAAGDLPAECADYKAAIDKLSACDKIPQATRDAMKTSFDSASTSWASMPAEAKASLATACKAGADGVKQTTAAMCP